MKPATQLRFVTLCVSVAMSTTAALAFPIDWARQLGTTVDDSEWFEAGNNVSSDGLGSVYLAGKTVGNLGGPNAGAPGSSDGFLGKYNSAGALLWTAQFGTAGYELVQGISADSLGNVFVGGDTTGSLGGPNAGSFDAFVSRYDANGNLQWTRQFGTAADEHGYGLAADGLGNVYFAGWTTGALAGPLVGSLNAFLYKYNSAGTVLWSRQLGVSPNIFGQAVTSDILGNAYLTGITDANFAATPAGFGDVFLTKYDPAGNLLWKAQLGSSLYEVGRAVATDVLGNVYVTGYTYGNLAGPNAGQTDAFLLKYNAVGVLQWSKQFGTADTDYGDGLSVDAAGDIYLSGTTYGSLYGPNLGISDVTLAKFDPSGNLLASMQFGTPSDDFSNSISIDATGAIYVSGTTTGSFDRRAPRGGLDVYLVKFLVPEPSGCILLLLASAWLSSVGRIRGSNHKL